mgnify:CR=1 FL=1
MRIRPRFLAQALAFLGGYFWLPCPICGEPFAGFEWGDGILATSPGGGVGVCSKPECEAEAARRSDEVYAAHGMRIIRQS